MPTTQRDFSQAREDFNAFFMINYPTNINLSWLNVDAVPDHHALESNMPEAFKLINLSAQLAPVALKPMPALGAQSEQLIEYLRIQSTKIDVLLAHMLQQQDDANCRYTTLAFGAAGCKVLLDETVALGQIAEVKLFIDAEAIAVFCYGEVIELEPEDNGVCASILFSTISEQDQEALVKATMHIQSQQLRQRQQRTKQD